MSEPLLPAHERVAGSPAEKQGAEDNKSLGRSGRNTAIFGLVLYSAWILFLGWSVSKGLSDGLPSNRLISYSGHLISAVESKYQIRIALAGSKHRSFDYLSKVGHFGEVERALCADCTVTVWIDPYDQSEYPTVFQLAVNGKIVRSNSEIKSDWIADNEIARWLFALFSLGGLYFVFIFRRHYNRAKNTGARAS